MRVALISDLHGNAVALRAVLRELKSSKVDSIVCLGDVATLGPSPHEVLEMLAELRCPCIRGNHDDFLVDESAIDAYTDAPVVVEAVKACRAETTAEELAFVASFKSTLELDLGHGTVLGVFHGSPRSNTEDLLATTPAAELDAALGDEQPTVMAGGHTHIQMLRQHQGRLLVNPGSVGLAFESYVHGGPPRVLPHAEYAIVEAGAKGVSVRLCRLRLDPRELSAPLNSWDNPMAGYLKAQYAA